MALLGDGDEIAEAAEVHIEYICKTPDPYIGRVASVQLSCIEVMEGRAMASEAKLLIVQFLEWLGARPRRYAEVRDAWASTCPLNCAFEDAIADELVEHTADGHIVLTARGRSLLSASGTRCEEGYGSARGPGQ